MLHHQWSRIFFSFLYKRVWIEFQPCMSLCIGPVIRATSLSSYSCSILLLPSGARMCLGRAFIALSRRRTRRCNGVSCSIACGSRAALNSLVPRPARTLLVIRSASQQNSRNRFPIQVSISEPLHYIPPLWTIAVTSSLEQEVPCGFDAVWVVAHQTF